jgi:hypothetical protein
MTGRYVVREVFHMGNDKVTTDHPINGDPNPFSITEALAGSLYVNPVTNPQAPQAIRDMLDGKEGGMGWCWLTLVHIAN